MNFYLQLAPGELSRDYDHLKKFIDDRPHLHIGKSSMGWCFSMHVIPELKINSWADWRKFRTSYGVKIVDEDLEEVSILNLIDRVENRSCKRPLGKPEDIFEKPKDDFLKNLYKGIETWGDFYKQNSAIPGPNNLLRHDMNAKYSSCVGYGEGTWDYLTGEYS